MTRIQTKIAAALLGVFAPLLLSAAIVLQVVVAPNFDRLEADLNARDATRVVANLDTFRSDITSRVLDYARWDDTYAFVQGRNRQYVETNFTPQWFDDYHIDLAAFLNDKGELLWRGNRTAALADDSDIIRSILADVGGTARARAHTRSGVIWSAAGPLMYATAPSVHSTGRGEPHGLVILARQINGAVLSTQTQLPMQLFAVNNPRFKASDFAPIANGENIATHVERDRLATAVALRSADGDLVGVALGHRARTISQLGQQAFWIALGLALVSCAIASAVLWLLLQRIVISPLTRIERDLQAQSPSNVKPIEGVALRDEIGRVVCAYNELISRLRQSEALKTQADLARNAEASANQAKSIFLANLSHELRTPLNAIIGYAELVEEEVRDEIAADVRRIQGSARHLLLLINDILDLSRIEAGRLSLAPHAFLVSDLVRSIEDHVRPLAEANDNKLKIVIEPFCGDAYTDELRLKQCLINVVGNACKFTQNGQITVKASRGSRNGQDELRFEISDTGVGMSPASLTRIFEPFVQADQTISRRFGGTGLGLALTKKTLGLLGGDITATSIEGEGSIFALRVPATLPDDEANAAA